MKCGVWSVKTLLRLSLKEKPLVEGRTRSGQGVFELYRSFMFGKLPPPACPGLCYYHYITMLDGQIEYEKSLGHR